MFARTGRIRSGEEGPYAPGGTFDRVTRAHGSRESARRRGAATLRHLQGAGLTNLGPTTGAPMERGPDALGYSIMAGDVKGLIGHMERLGVATAAEVVPETFEVRLRAGAAATDTVLSSPPTVGARART